MVPVNPDRLELRHCHLPLIGPPFPEQHLPRPALPREHRSIRHIPPDPHRKANYLESNYLDTWKFAWCSRPKNQISCVLRGLHGG
jgi:hypothetical protein